MVERGAVHFSCSVCFFCFRADCRNNGMVHAQPYVNNFLEMIFYSLWAARMPAFDICTKKGTEKGRVGNSVFSK